MARTPRSTASTALIEILCNLLAPMDQFCRPDHLAGGLCGSRRSGDLLSLLLCVLWFGHHGDPSGLGSRIELEPQRLNRRSWPGLPQNNSKRIPSQHSGMPCCEQESGTAWMNGTLRLALLIQHKHVRHSFSPTLKSLRLRG
jgi:hypothetical protein